MIIDVKDALGRPVDLRGWGASAIAFYEARLTADADVEDVEWEIGKGEGTTYPVVGDSIETLDCDSEVVSVTDITDCTTVVISREDSSGFDHLAGAKVRITRGSLTAAAFVTTKTADDEDLSYLLDDEAYDGDVHQSDDGRWYTESEHSLSSELLEVVGDETITLSQIRVYLNETVTAKEGKFWVRVTLVGPDEEIASLPRSGIGYCLIVSR